MNFLGIIIGTGIIWLLTALVVNPVARALTNARNRELQLSFNDGRSSIQAKATTQVSTGYYILVNVIVLGIAGLLLGYLARWFFIGFAWEKKSWPGVIAFVVTSIIGVLISG
jgi:NADH:ubiquinone oxidoreductase subunit 2 (subunit N)